MHLVQTGKPENVQRFLDKLTDEERECYYWEDSKGESYKSTFEGKSTMSFIRKYRKHKRS